MTTFTDIGLSEEILQAITAQGFEEPTPVQAKVIPLMLEQEVDIVSLAQTGTGKTAGRFFQTGNTSALPAFPESGNPGRMN